MSTFAPEKIFDIQDELADEARRIDEQQRVSLEQIPETVAGHQAVMKGDEEALEKAIQDRVCPYLNQFGKAALEGTREEVREAHKAFVSGDVDALIAMARQKTSSQKTEQVSKPVERVAMEPVVTEATQRSISFEEAYKLSHLDLQAKAHMEDVVQLHRQTTETAKERPEVHAINKTTAIVTEQKSGPEQPQSKVVEHTSMQITLERHAPSKQKALKVIEKPLAKIAAVEKAVRKQAPQRKTEVTVTPKTVSRVQVTKPKRKDAPTLETKKDPVIIVQASVEVSSDAAVTRTVEPIAQEMETAVTPVTAVTLAQERIETVVQQVVPLEEQPAIQVIMEQIEAVFTQELEVIEYRLLDSVNQVVDANIETMTRELDQKLEVLIEELVAKIEGVEPELIRELVLQLRAELMAEAAEKAAGKLGKGLLGMREARTRQSSSKHSLRQSVHTLIGRIAMLRPRTA